MHLLRVESRSIDGTAEAVDLEQTPGGYRRAVVHRHRPGRPGRRLGGEQGHLAQPAPGQPDRLAPPLFGRPLRRKGPVQGSLRAGSPARRHGLLALRGRRTRDTCPLDRLAISRSCRATIARTRGWMRPQRCTQRRCARSGPISPPAGSTTSAPVCASSLATCAPRPSRRAVSRRRRYLRVRPLRPGAHMAAPTGAPSALIVFYRTWMLAADTAPGRWRWPRACRTRLSTSQPST